MAATLGSITVDAVLSRASAERLRVEVEALVAAVRADAAAVRTVGDLTARHVGKRVRVEGHKGTLSALFAGGSLSVHVDEVGAGDLVPTLWLIPATLDTPCEVLS